jgi:hypothetical protein
MANLKLKIKKWISQKAEQCRTVAPLYAFALDRRLTLRERFRIRFHLLTCNACTNYVDNLNFMHKVFQAQEEQIEEGKLHSTLSDEAKIRLKRKIKEQNL